MPHKNKIIILQRLCPSYRVGVFKMLTNNSKQDICLYIGDNIQGHKAKNASCLAGINYKQFANRIIKLGTRVMPWPKGLIKAFYHAKPDVIVCEADSHFLGYIQAIIYKVFLAPRVKLIHWCFIMLPGENQEKSLIRSWIKKFTRKFFAAFIVYSSYSKERLLEKGIAAKKIFVATNVCDTALMLQQAKQITTNAQQTKQLLKLPEQFTVLYIGSFGANKNFDLFIELAALSSMQNYNFVMLGGGPLLDSFRNRVESLGINNIILPGRVNNVAEYLRAADLVLVPGRGGIVISEAMCFGVPVIVHQADGIEYDLIANKNTGIIVNDAAATTFATAIYKLANDPALLNTYARNCQAVIENSCSTQHMAVGVLAAINFAQDKRC